MQRNLFTGLMFGVMMIFAVLSCSKSTNSTGDGGAIVKFELMPYPAPLAGKIQAGTITKRFKFHCIDKTNVDCFTTVHVSEPDDGDWFSYPQDYSTCAPFFAEVNVFGTAYSFTGTVQRAFSQGTGPFVIGNYTSYDATYMVYGAGEFNFYEQLLTEGTSPVCPN